MIKTNYSKKKLFYFKMRGKKISVVKFSTSLLEKQSKHKQILKPNIELTQMCTLDSLKLHMCEMQYEKMKYYIFLNTYLFVGKCIRSSQVMCNVRFAMNQ